MVTLGYLLGIFAGEASSHSLLICRSSWHGARRTIWIVDAHRGDGKRFVERADEKMTVFVELERAVCIHLLSEQC